MGETEACGQISGTGYAGNLDNQCKSVRVPTLREVLVKLETKAHQDLANVEQLRTTLRFLLDKPVSEAQTLLHTLMRW